LKRESRLPGAIATGLMTITTALWTFWGVAEMYYEGWGNPFPAPLAYLIPGLVCLLLSVIVVTWPFIGGLLILLVGSSFTIWWVGLTASRGNLSLVGLLVMFPVSGMLLLIGILFLLEARYRRYRKGTDWIPPANWVARNFRYVVVVGTPVLVFIAVSAFSLPNLMNRIDDGDRSARLIEGNGVTLVWAPAGPGWNWKQPWGGYPSWNSIALYGVEPVGIDARQKPGYEDKSADTSHMATTSLCHYLSEDGLTLRNEPQNIWRMPTTEEVVRSLVLRGENAGCSWNGNTGWADCPNQPDKETPLWAPDQEPIYLWTADEASMEGQAYYVSYNGAVHDQPKSWGNPRHGYRCVREVPTEDEAQVPSSTSEAPSEG